MIAGEKGRTKGELNIPEQILNEIREADDNTLTTPEIAERVPVGKRTVQGYVRDLQEEGSLVLESEGKPNHWRLSDSEPKEPVYREEYAEARRIANRASKYGDKSFITGLGIFAAIGLVTTGNIYITGLNIGIPVLQDGETVVMGGIVGILGIGLFLAAFIAYFTALVLPGAVEWYISGKYPEDR